MAIQINNLSYINQENRWIFPLPDVATTADRMFIVCDNDELAQRLIAGINDHLSGKRTLSVAAMNDIIDETLTSGGQKLASSSLAMAIMGGRGCLVVQMGKSRVLHLAVKENEIAYDSRNHILDTLSSKARIHMLNDIDDGDMLLITLSDMVDAQALLRITADVTPADSASIRDTLVKLLSMHRGGQPPASYLLQFGGRTGLGANVARRIKDVNWKWMSLYIVLAAVIAAIALLALNGNISLPAGSIWGGQEVEQVVPADSLNRSDTIAPPQPIEIPQEEVSPHDSASTKRIVRDDTPQRIDSAAPAPVPKAQEPAIVEPEPTTTEEPTTPPPAPEP